MTNTELKRLQLNLTKSAIKAKKFYVRGMIGNTESDQGFFSIELIPVYNPIQQKETTLKELIEDVGELRNDHDKLEFLYMKMVDDIIKYKENQKNIQTKNEKDLDALNKRISDLESFKID